MAKLCVNVDHVATVRQARMIDAPDPLEAAMIAEAAGAVGITVHLREDRRHIQDNDVARLRKAVKTKLNLEMATAPEIVEFALKTRPDQVTFVPERRREVTTEGGLDVTVRQRRLKKIIDRFRDKKIVVSLFIDPDADQIDAALALGAGAVELNTGQYSEARTKRAARSEMAKIKRAAARCAGHGLVTHAGHGLNLANVGPVAAIETVDELNIGHSIVGRAVMVGFAEAVKEMARAMKGAARGGSGP